ncbi:helix-turn-helix domain-containing protein [Atopobium sp. oral taxon 810]|uniref:XRE family transcriptional regulator n=1 Tax=Atopobium sp. oral taxon 810 TaxID=712158 RepID=UPI0004121799|nr:helix-turn-helix domain-containing protein [Atopobium sp. oral taxon 810]
MSGFIVAPGEVIKEYLDARGLSQKEVCKRLGVSEKHLSNMLNGKTRLTEEMALKLEKIMPDVPASFWLNYEVKYQEYLAREREEHEIEGLDLKDIAKRFNFREVFRGAGMTLTEQALAMLKILGISSFDRYPYAIPANMEYMQDGGEPESVVVWIKLCDQEIDIQNADLTEPPYSEKELRSMLGMLKDVALNTNIEESINSCRNLLNMAGVYLVYHPEVGKPKIRGALGKHNGHPVIYISGRFKTHADIWFAIAHEIMHLLEHYDPKQVQFLMDKSEEPAVKSSAEKDDEANRLARKFFIDECEYDNFVEAKDFSSAAVRDFAASQNVAPGIVVAFLQHDRRLGYQQLNYLKSRMN